MNATNQDGWTPLGVAAFAQAPRGDYPGVARALLKAGARLDARTELGETPVTQAAKAGRADLLAIFREAGAKVYYAKDGKAFTEAGAKIAPADAVRMMQKAIQNRQYGVIAELSKMGLDVNAPIYHGYTPLIYAIVFREDPKAVATLLDAGADVNLPLIETSGEPTPLLLAARRKNADVVRALIAAGARMDVRDAQGQTPLDLALTEKNQEIAKILRKAGAKERTQEKQ